MLGWTRGEAGWAASAAAGASVRIGGYTRYFESDWLSLALSFESRSATQTDAARCASASDET